MHIACHGSGSFGGMGFENNMVTLLLAWIKPGGRAEFLLGVYAAIVRVEGVFCVH